MLGLKSYLCISILFLCKFYLIMRKYSVQLPIPILTTSAKKDTQISTEEDSIPISFRLSAEAHNKLNSLCITSHFIYHRTRLPLFSF